jgi:hypothetical protein
LGSIPERRRGITLAWKNANMSLHTELGLFGLADYKDVAPAALPERLNGVEPLHLR